MPFMLPLEPLLKAEQDCSDSNPNLPPPPHTRTQARTHPRVRTRTHAHTHKCTRTHVRARTRMLEPTPFHTPLLTPGSPDPPALPTAPRWRHHGLGVPSAPSSAAPFPAHDGQRWGCTGQASSPRSPPGGGLRPGRGGGARHGPISGHAGRRSGLAWTVSQHEPAPGPGVCSPLSWKVTRPGHRPGSDSSAGLLPRDQRRGARRAGCLRRPVPEQSVLIKPHRSQCSLLHNASWLGAEDLASISTGLLQQMQKCRVSWVFHGTCHFPAPCSFAKLIDRD